VEDRKVEDRLVLGCRENSILLASIIKYRGIPARARYGHATYLIPGFYVSHIISEVWDEDEKRWMLVDPGTGMIDFSRDKFDLSNEAWLKLQRKEIDPNIFGIPGKYAGMGSIVLKVVADLASVLGTEYTGYQYAPILDYAVKNDGQLTLTAQQIEIVNGISELMKSIDSDNLSKLREIYNNTPEIQITKTIEPDTKKLENNTKAKNTSIQKPDIEFVDIPSGTFLMGSPVTEQGRKDDEIEGEVTLNAFKMNRISYNLRAIRYIL
jgi:hypothetical protein